MSLTAARAREFLEYDPKSGSLRWAVDRSSRVRKGDDAGYIKKKYHTSYLVISIDYQRYYGHRLVWLINHGEWPDGQIDHINGDGLDNRMENLRVVSHEENAKNQPISIRNTSGVTGVFWHGQLRKWRAEICVNRKRINIGCFDDLSLAAKARKDAEKKYGYHENHGKIRVAA